MCNAAKPLTAVCLKDHPEEFRRRLSNNMLIVQESLGGGTGWLEVLNPSAGVFLTSLVQQQPHMNAPLHENETLNTVVGVNGCINNRQ